MLVTVYDDFLHKRIEQLRIKAVEEIRPILQRIHEIAGAICQIVAVSVEKPCLFLLQPAKLFAELVIGGYKSIRVNAARLLKLGQKLNLTECSDIFLLREMTSSLQSIRLQRIFWRFESICVKMGLPWCLSL